MAAPKCCRLPAGIWAFGFVSLLMDVLSEMIHALLLVYLVVGFGATAGITKVFSAALRDRIDSCKELAAQGYGLAAITKPVFPLAP